MVREPRAGICLPGARAPRADPQAADPQAADPQAADPQVADPQVADPWRFRPGARFRAAIVQRHIAHGLLKRGGLVCAPGPRSARRANVLARPMSDKLAPAIAPWAGEA